MEVVSGEEQSRVRHAVGAFLLVLSELSFGAMIVLAPLRYRWLLHENPILPLFVEYTNRYRYPADTFLLLTLALWLISLPVTRKSITLRPYWLTMALAGLVAVSAVSSLFSLDPQLSFYHSVRMAALFGLYLYAINAVRAIGWVAIGAGIQSLLQSAIGIAQVLRQHSLGLVSLKELPLDPAVNGISIVWTNGLRSLRAYGLTDHPNILGGCLALALILLVVLYLESRPSRRIWIMSLLCVGAVALLVTFSRAAWLGLAAGLAGLLAWLAAARQEKHLIDLARLAGPIALILLPFLWSYAPLLSTRLGTNGSFSQATPENQAINERALLSSQALHMIQDNPLIGTGVGTFPEALLRHNPTYPFAFQPPHIVPLEVAAEIGVPGGILYLCIMVAPWALLLINRKRLHPSLALMGTSAALLAIGVISFLDYYPWLLNPGRIWQWMLWGLWASCYQSALNRESHD